MKRTLLFTVLIFSIATALAQPKLTSILHQFKSQSSGWQTTSEDTFTYNNNGHLKTLGLNLIWHSVKTPNTIDSNYYSSSGLLDSTKSFKWNTDSNTWKITYERLIKYKYNGTKLQKRVRLTEGINSPHEYVDSFIYNSNGQEIERYIFIRERKSGMGNYLTRFKNKYSSTGGIIEQIYQNLNAGSWNSTSRTTYKYNSSDSLVESLGESFQGGAWVNGTRTTYTYNNNVELIEEFDERYKASKSSWENGDKLEHIYTSGKKVYTVKHLYIGSTWFAVDTTKFVYNPDGTVKEIYPPHQGTELRTLFFYKNLSTSLDEVKGSNSVKIYPNPSTGKFTIELEGSSPATINIANIAGKQVYTTKASGDLDVDLTNLQKGIYLVNIKSKENNSTQRIIIQ